MALLPPPIVWEEPQKPEGACNSLPCHPTANMNELIVKKSIKVGFLDPLSTLWKRSHIKQGLTAYILADTRD